MSDQFQKEVGAVNEESTRAVRPAGQAPGIAAKGMIFPGIARASSSLSTRPRTGSWRAFARHFFEMLAAMVVGMAVLGGAVSLVFWLLGQGDLLNPVPVRTILMATDMSIGMGLWMRHRGHAWSRVAEMSAAMYAPFLVLLGPYSAGLIGPGPVMGGGHLLMLVSMLAAMLPRYAEYSHDHRAHSPAIADHHVDLNPEGVSA